MQTPNLNSLPFTLVKRSSVMDGLTLIEKIPIERIKALLKSDLLLTHWQTKRTDSSHKKQVMELYNNEVAQLKEYLKKYDRNIGGIPTKYNKPKHKWGRSFPFKAVGLSSFRRKIRNTLIEGLYYDFDLKNAQPEMLRLLCESNNVEHPNIARYCGNRDALLLEVQNHYGVERKEAKELFIRLCFFGTFSGWCLDNNLQGKKPLEFITNFERELKTIAEIAKKENKELYETARKKKEDGGDNQDNKILGSFMSLYLQEYECRIVEAIFCYFRNHTSLMKIDRTNVSAGAYEYDGLKLLKENVDAYDGGVNGLVELLNEKTYELTGFRLQWVCKPIDETLDLEPWLASVADSDKPNDELRADMEKINKALNDADCGIIETIMGIKPNHYIYKVDEFDTSKGEWYGWNGNRWEKGDAPLRMAIIYDVATYWNSIMKPWDELYSNQSNDPLSEDDPNYKLYKKTKDAMDARIWTLKTADGIQKCVTVGKTLMKNPLLEFDVNPDLFGCENGVIDIKEECFRYYRFDDYVTFSCGYDFIPLQLGFKVQIGTEELAEGEKVGKPIFREVDESDLNQESKDSFMLLMDTFQKIFPDKELREYFFKIISTGMSGRAIEKFFVFNGSGRNGKGLTNEFLEKVFGTYFTSVSPLIYSENQKNKSSSGPNPELAKLDKKRYIVSREPQRDAPLHNSVIKDLTGGGTTSGRMCHSSKTKVMLCGTTVMECNDKPPFSEAPKDADVERINDIVFASKFCNERDEWDETTGENNYIYPVNAGLKEQLKESNVHKNTMLNILLQNLLMVKEQSYNVDYFKPDSVKQRSMAYLQNSYDLHNIFSSLFEKRIESHADHYVNWKGAKEDTDWTLSKVALHIRKSPDFMDLSKQKQKEYKTEVIEEFFCKNNFYKSSIYMNENKHAIMLRDWRLKVEIAEEKD